ncbi:hypothetical protein B5C34_14970 [Pacificimonas flava]|uniref:Biopolymer transporter Tol n=2 Tax=Pacificimonas TaxID=1960290 RepID=A0A219B1W9_9SPHN|nr:MULTISPECIES: hypothetical protein [Pacificimonas]MBZ6379735.1 hypothetical protein [Pacificimonas aurantium]OWV31809.1 hypothetical protein B5C34_14970 [Pacificimonas flava]
MAADPQRTPDGRYIIVDGRLWRAANPDLSRDDHSRLVSELMSARRAVGSATRSGDETAEREARGRVHAAKVALGERGPVWWADGARDETRTLVRNSSYARWWETRRGEE